VDEQQHEYLKVPEVAEVLRISRSRAYEMVAEGEIPSVRIERSVRVNRKEFDRWLEEQPWTPTATCCPVWATGSPTRWTRL